MKKYLPFALALAALVTAGATPVLAQASHHRAVQYSPASPLNPQSPQLGGPGGPEFGISSER